MKLIAKMARDSIGMAMFESECITKEKFLECSSKARTSASDLVNELLGVIKKFKEANAANDQLETAVFVSGALSFVATKTSGETVAERMISSYMLAHGTLQCVPE